MTKSTKDALISLAVIITITVGFVWYAVASGFPVGPAIGLTIWVFIGFAVMVSSRESKNKKTQLEQAISLFALLAWPIAMGIWAEGASFLSAIGGAVVSTFGLAVFFWLCWYLMEGRYHD